MKTCAGCGASYKLDEFYIADKKTGRRRGKCRSCMSEYYKKYKASDKSAIQEKWREASKKYYTSDKRRNKTLRTYGLTEETYNTLYDAQGGVCAICKRNLGLAVDHDHFSGKIRGLLCQSCNIGLGHFQDDVDRLKSAVLYLSSAG